MTRVAVVGNAGGGKTTLCKRLSEARGLPLLVIDLVQWKPGWVHATPEEIRAQHDPFIAGDRWIVDGWGGMDLMRERFRAADTLVFIDFPLPVHYYWSLKRQAACLFRPREDLPEDCPMVPKTWELLKVMRYVHTQLRPQVLDALEEFRPDKQVFHLRSPRELRAFIKEYG